MSKSSIPGVWNRSSSFSAEQIAAFNTLIERSVRTALAAIETDPVLAQLDEEQKAEARGLLAAGVVDKLSQWIESLKTLGEVKL
jgi:hypothetical protein